MKSLSNFKTNPFRALSFLCAVTLLCLCFGSFVAANKNSDRQFSKKVGKKTHEALQLMNNQDYKPATIKLETLLKKSNLSAYERSTIYQMNGEAYYQLDEPQLAIQAFEDAISAGGLLPNEANTLRKMIAQVHIVKQDYLRGAEMLEQWERDGNALKSGEVDLILNAWVQSENYERALPWAERWLDAANPKRRKHYDLLNFLYFHFHDTEKQVTMIEAMVERWPEDRNHWHSLESIYAKTGREQDAFDVMTQMYDRGFIRSERDILKFVQYHAYFKLFGKGSYILYKEMDEKRVSETPDNLVYLSQLYEMSGQYGSSKEAFQKAVNLSDFETANALKTDVTRLPPETSAAGIPNFSPSTEKKRGNFKITVSDRDAQPIVRISAIMPQGMTTSGSCKMRFNVINEGQPIDVTTTFCTDKGFEQAAIETVEKWKFNPKIRDGRALPRTGVETTVHFTPTDTSR